MRRFKSIGFRGRQVSFRRDIQKSVRLDSRVHRYIMQLDGSDFADKLENLVIDHAKFTGKSEGLIH